MKIIIVSIIIIFFLGIQSHLFGMDRVEVDFTPVRMLENSAALPVELTITNFSGVPIKEVWIHYRFVGEIRFKSQPLKNESFRYFADVRLGEPDGNILEYFFSIHYLDARIETFPADASEGRVFRTVMQTSRNLGDEIVIISPEPEEQVFSSDVVIAASFARFASQVDIKKTRIYLDTWELSRYIQKYGDFICFAPSKVPLGRHKVRLELYDKNANLIASREWFFTAIAPRGPQTLTTVFNFSGRFFAETRQEQLLGGNLVNDYNQSGLQLQGNLGRLNFGGRVYLSNQESSHRQPVNRYSGFTRFNFWNDRFLNVLFGDAYPRLNPIIMQNILLRGVHGTLFLKFLNLDVAYGTTTRAIEGKTRIDTLDGNVEKVIERYGTFRRKVLAVRPSFGAGKNFQLGFTYLRGIDDTTSIEIGQNPQQNLAVGADLFIGLDQQRIVFEGNVNASVYNRNITGGTVEFDSLKDVIEDLDRDFYDLARKFITINQYLIPRPGLAYQARLRLRYLRNNFNILYESIDEDFYSLGQPYLLRDNRGIHIVDNINLIQNQVFITLGYRKYHNNLQEIKTATSKNTNIYVNLSYYPLQNFPEITIGFSNYTRNNGVPADSINSSLNRPEDNKTNAINFSTGYKFALFGLKHHFSVNMMNYQREDIYKTSENKSNYFAFNLRTDYQSPLQTNLEFITQEAKSGEGTSYENNLELTTFGIGAQYRIRKIVGDDQLFLRVKARLSDLKTTSYNYNRNFFSFRINYSYPKIGNLGLSLDIINYHGDREYNDMIYSIRYDYRF